MKPALATLTGVFFLGQVVCAQNRALNGDANADGKLNIADARYLLLYLFGEGPEPIDIPCPACDSCCPEVSRLLKTGFDLSFDLLTGWATAELAHGSCCFFECQDGYNQAGVTRRYELVTFDSEDAADWISVDYATGLMWQTLSPEEHADDLGEAIEVCDNLVLGPFDDWRLPNINELLTLIMFPHVDEPLCRRRVYTSEASVNRDFFRWRGWPGNIPGVGSYWSSTITAHPFWTYGMQVKTEGSIFYFGASLERPGYTRAVREILPGDLELLGLPESPSAFFTEAPANGDVDGNGTRDLADVIYLLAYLFSGWPPPARNECPPCDSCCPDFPARPLKTGCEFCYRGAPCTGRRTGADGWVRAGVDRKFEVVRFGDKPEEWATVDHATGLMWRYTCLGPVYTYAEALALCGRFRHFGGFTDWRIPNIFEVLSLVDYRVADMHVFKDVFAYPPGAYFHLISSTLYVRRPHAEADPTDCDRSLNLNRAYVLDFRYPRLTFIHPTYPSTWPPYVRLVRTLQPGDLEK